ncbi:MAG: polyamine aminopropyltransferase [Sulfolobales archaeon]|nr:polyamine aminopropyltransferase [Sulfolobales archaeon]MCX8209120.1 polyamine aminopropyltransferase [Sulfolobales archaeon]MDW8010195.1 polyamine aminopropyltransferase [Sulfolobales archaeon]
MLGVYVIQAIGRTTYMLIKARSVVVSRRSRYQQIDVVDTEEFGRVLVLDGLVQSTEVDEFYYHELLTHPAMVLHPNPRRVLILGGGEGAALREVLKYKTVERAVMVDIDEEVVNVSKEFLVSWHAGAFSDPRAEVVIEDGRTFVERVGEKFDVVVMDLTDPYGPEIARALYREDFIKKLSGILTDCGVISTQAGTSFFYPEEYDELKRGLEAVFGRVSAFSAWIPSFGYSCSFIVASRGEELSNLSEEEIDRRLRSRGVVTRFFSGRTFKALLAIPEYRKLSN